MIDVTDAMSSPSSLMPQKKNALVLEYVRSRTARTVGALTGCFAVMHNVGYMDTEEVEFESYQPLIEALELTESALPSLEAVVATMEPNRKLMRDRAAQGFSSVTALAELVQTTCGLSYRTAHRAVARAVLLAVERGKDATGIDAALLDEAARDAIGRPLNLPNEAICECLDPRRFVDQHAVSGGAAPAEVRRMASKRHARLESDAGAVADLENGIGQSRDRLHAAVQRIVASS
jgi:argininosuccinate lyase